VRAGAKAGRPAEGCAGVQLFIVYRSGLFVQVHALPAPARLVNTEGPARHSVPLLQQQGEVSIRHEQYAGRNLASCGDAAVGICPVEIHAALMCSLQMLIWRDTYRKMKQ